MHEDIIDRFMTSNVHTIAANRTLEEAHELMRSLKVRHLPVLRGGKVVGMVSQRDLSLIESLPGVDPRTVTVDDAISATKAAIAEGIVPGAGLALLRAASALEVAEKDFEGDERTGLKILRAALEAPTRQIGENAGVDGGVIVDRMRAGAGNTGYDADAERYVDLYEAGIVDPTKVVRVALENAVSVASVLLLTEATMTEVEEPEKDRGRGMEEAM